MLHLGLIVITIKMNITNYQVSHLLHFFLLKLRLLGSDVLPSVVPSRMYLIIWDRQNREGPSKH